MKCTVKPIFFCTVPVVADEFGPGNLKSIEITLDGFETRSTTCLKHSDVATAHISTRDAVRRPPQHADRRDAGQVEGDPQRITSPLRGSTYAMRVKRAEESRIAFNATARCERAYVVLVRQRCVCRA